MLPHDVARCAGFAPGTQHDKCPRRGDCARFRSPATCVQTGAMYPFEWSACEGGDSFVHVATVAESDAAAHPHVASPSRVLDANTATQNRG